MRCVSSLPLFSREHGQQIELVRREMHRSAADRDGVLLEVDANRPDLEHRLAVRSGPPQNGAETSEQLADRERLRHVVVRSGIERRDLLGLVPDRRHDHDRHRGPPASSRQTSVPVMSGSTRSRMIASRWPVARRRQRVLDRWLQSRRRSRRRRASSSGRARVAARRRRRGSAPAHLATGAGTAASAGSARVNVAPWPGCELDPNPPPVGRGEATGDGKSEPRAGDCRRRHGGTARRCARARPPGTPGP